LLLKKDEKEHLVIKLALEGLTTREIAKAAHISFKDIGTIIRKYNGEDRVYQNNTPSITSKAFQMFKDGKSKIQVAIDLNLEKDDVVTLFEDYLSLVNLDKLMSIYKELDKDIYLFHYLFHHLKCEGIATKDAISRFADMVGRLTKLDEEELRLCEQIGKLNSKKGELEREIEEALKELDNYDVSLIEKQQNL
jgi:hypothetical protein